MPQNAWAPRVVSAPHVDDLIPAVGSEAIIGPPGERVGGVVEVGQRPRSGRGPLRLDKEGNNSGIASDPLPEGPRVVAEWRGGKLDPKGGMAGRLNDLARFGALVESMHQPVFITLTPDRARFQSPADAYASQMKQVSELMRQLGVKLWGRVIEPQAKSGGGYMHWHIVAEVGGTQWDGSKEAGKDWVKLKELRAAIVGRWCHRWQFGGEGGQHLERVRSRGGMVGYLTKYVVKPWPAIPGWVLDRKLMRCVGFSKEANVLFRELGVVEPRQAAAERPEGQRAKRPVGRLLERLAASGLRSKVIVKGGGFCGTLPGTPEDLAVVAHLRPDLGLSIVPRVVVSAWSVVHKSIIVLKEGSRAAVERVRVVLDELGLGEEMQARYVQRLAELRDAWDRMQLGEGVPT